MTMTHVAASFFVNNGEASHGRLSVSEPVEWHWSQGPRPDPQWSFVDSQGHWHAFSHEKAEPYPTLEAKVEQVACDGSCGGICQGEGFHVTRYLCRACGEEVAPGTIPGPHRFSVPRPKEWSAEVEQRLKPGERVSVRFEVEGDVRFGVAEVVAISHDSFAEAWTSELIGIGPLGRRKA